MKILKNMLKHLLLVLPLVLFASCNLGDNSSNTPAEAAKETNNTSEDNPSDILAEAAKEANTLCPKRVDYITVLKEVSYENHTFLYVYEVDDDPDAYEFMEIDDDFLVEVFSEELKEKADNDSDVKAFVDELRKDNATLIYRYIMGDGSGQSRDVFIKY